jgi:dynein heavy chain 1
VVGLVRLNLEGYPNLEHWVAELDKPMEVSCYNVCFEFDRVSDGDTRQDVPVLDTFSKRRGDE